MWRVKLKFLYTENNAENDTGGMKMCLWNTDVPIGNQVQNGYF